MRADQGGAQGGLLVGGPGSGVPDRDPQPQHRAVGLRLQRDRRAQRPPPTHQPPRRHLLDVLATVDPHSELRSRGPARGPGRRPAPARPRRPRPTSSTRRPRCAAPAPRRTLPLRRRARPAARCSCRKRRCTVIVAAGSARPQEALRREVGVLSQSGRGRPGRAEHAELPPHLVLGRRRPVGVEQIPLVEDGVSGQPGQGEGHGRSPREACSSSVVTASSQVVWPWTCR